VGSVELEIGGSHGLQLVGLLPEQLRDVGEEVLEAPVLGRSALGIAEVREETTSSYEPARLSLDPPIGLRR
jgi:hypothetical protein